MERLIRQVRASALDIACRAYAILRRPRAAWAVIRDERTDNMRLFISYVMILAAVPRLAHFVGKLLVGHRFLGIHYHPPFASALLYGLVSYGATLIEVAIVAVLTAAAAPHFKAKRDRANALKLVAYASTPGWAAGVLLLVPALSPVVTLLSLYSYWLLYLGLPVLMEPSPRARFPYFIMVAAAYTVTGAFIFSMAGLAFLYGR